MYKYNSYIATQTEKGFKVEFENPNKNPLDLTFEDISQFTRKYNEELLAGKQPELDDKGELILSICEMMLIPTDKTVH